MARRGSQGVLQHWRSMMVQKEKVFKRSHWVRNQGVQRLMKDYKGPCDVTNTPALTPGKLYGSTIFDTGKLVRSHIKQKSAGDFYKMRLQLNANVAEQQLKILQTRSL
ncbi:hypothetical protein L1987_05390 [Smallanthus sonchifolius]|uniref:Uncharacterized protein n=1 Tax=Smallanthus sonchifolius TaxID=185202 RepID=A0ACB9JV74_9ASTR|nr:hypothetical protein L1987_05390 [Smallanthus sonchifolius]